jgi:hypothetical protein
MQAQGTKSGKTQGCRAALDPKEEGQKDPVLSSRLCVLAVNPLRLFDFFYYTTYCLSTGFEQSFPAALK